ncbi:hypothetical protein SDC9_66109 [bioreactor metagenome]|uniref:Uncharacterized protein n=1 Tax=bioreactor metagenome TaxID=1076179 RepID=A0A644XZI4_9ZZZZ
MSVDHLHSVNQNEGEEDRERVAAGGGEGRALDPHSWNKQGVQGDVGDCAEGQHKNGDVRFFDHEELVADRLKEHEQQRGDEEVREDDGCGAVGLADQQKDWLHPRQQREKGDYGERAERFEDAGHQQRMVFVLHC